MNISVNDFIKHEGFRDVAIHVRTIVNTGYSLRIEGYWINQGFVDSFSIMPLKDVLEIELRDLSKWFVCKNQTPKCLRYETWESLKAGT